MNKVLQSVELIAFAIFCISGCMIEDIRAYGLCCISCFFFIVTAYLIQRRQK